MQKMKKTIEGSGSDLFICFTSRPSASSAATMRVPSSKSLMSPNRSGGSNPSIPSLSSSLSRRLRNSGSIKGGQSPMFPSAGAAVGRKKGVAFEAAEPSSPKVTCIGQVRVKSKKKNSKNAVARTRSGREASFRRSEAGGGRKAVSICAALRAFGSEMNCFGPCGWSLCSSGEQEQEQRKRKKRSSSSSSSCGAVFARWLMEIEEEGEEAEKGRELVGLVVEERLGKGEVGVFVREKEVELEFEEFFERRKEEIFERKGEVVVLEKEVEEEEEEAEEEKGRVSVCIPPRNALLLMRCRSDPVQMAALANRLWDSPAMKVQCEEEEDEAEEEEVGNEEKEKVVESKEKDEEEEEGEVGEAHVEQVSLDAEEVEKGVILDEQKGEALEEEKIIVAEEDAEKVEKEVSELDAHEGGGGENILGEVISAEEAAPEEEKVEGTKATDDELIEKEVKEEETLCVQRGGEYEGEEVEIILRRSISCSAAKSNELAKAKEGAKRRSFSYREKKEKRRHSFSMEREARRHSFCSEKEARRSSFSVDKDGRRRLSFSIEKENLGQKEKPIVVQSVKQTTKEEVPAAEKTVEAIEPKITEKPQAVAASGADEVREKIQVSKRDETQVVLEKEKKSRALPDCLLLMMYEPKLSMEVSKETWVCSTDFRWRPNYSHPTNQPSEAKAEDSSNSKDKWAAENKNVIAAVTTANAAIAHPPPSKPPPTVSAMEQKLLKSSAMGPLPQPPYEHFVLTRCKSEPLKSSARLAPDACFWESRHQPIGTAGIGF